MAAGNLQQDLMTRVAASAGIAVISGTTPIKRDETVSWCNAGTRHVQGRFIPKRITTALWTPGRLDKIIATTEMDTETGGSGFAQLPQVDAAAEKHIALFSAVLIAGYAAREVSLGELWDRSSGDFTPDTDEPIFAFGHDGTNPGIFYLPSAGTPTVTYFYIKQPEAMEYDVTETFPLSADLMPIVANFAVAAMWKANERNVELADVFENLVKGILDRLVSVTGEVEAQEHR
jgi:hypothetical protein